MMLLFAELLSAQSPDQITNYINTYKLLAIAEMQRSGIPASIILAQGIHETQAGTSDLVIASNNHFGIKCKDQLEWSVYIMMMMQGENVSAVMQPPKIPTGIILIF